MREHPETFCVQIFDWKRSRREFIFFAAKTYASSLKSATRSGDGNDFGFLHG